mgnify:CR=1 FL=1
MGSAPFFGWERLAAHGGEVDTTAARKNAQSIDLIGGGGIRWERVKPGEPTAAFGGITDGPCQVARAGGTSRRPHGSRISKSLSDETPVREDWKADVFRDFDYGMRLKVSTGVTTAANAPE